MWGGKCAKGGTRWFCPTDAAVWLQQSSQGLDDTWGATFLWKGPMERCITIVRATMDSWLLWRAFTNEEEDSTCKHPSHKDANEEWGRKHLQEAHNFCSSCWWLFSSGSHYLTHQYAMTYIENLLNRSCSERLRGAAMCLAATELFFLFSVTGSPQTDESITQAYFLPCNLMGIAYATDSS